MFDNLRGKIVAPTSRLDRIEPVGQPKQDATGKRIARPDRVDRVSRKTGDVIDFWFDPTTRILTIRVGDEEMVLSDFELSEELAWHPAACWDADTTLLRIQPLAATLGHAPGGGTTGQTEGVDW